MTTLAIIGSGIAGRSLIYSLAKEKKVFEKILLFSSSESVFPCTLHSTAIVAPRGLSSGHSPLGDLLLESYHSFSEHVELDKPLGVECIIQYTGATEKMDSFKKRYPHATPFQDFLSLETDVAQDKAYLIDPQTYGDWLLSEAKIMGHFELIQYDDFVTEVQEGERIQLKTQDEKSFAVDKVIFAGGSSNRFWKNHSHETILKTSKPSQGSYLEFNEVEWDRSSFSLTFNGHNLVWNKRLNRLLIGSTTMEVSHTLPPLNDLKIIYKEISEAVDLNLPELHFAEVKVGLREKAQKRSPYLFQEGHKIFLGGYYKNGFSLALKMAKTLSHRFL